MSKFAGLGLPVEQPCLMPILHPLTRQPLVGADGAPAYLELLSQDSTRAVRFEHEINDRRLRRRGAATAADLEAEMVDRLAAVTTGWRLLSLTGEPIDVPFTPAAARELYADNAMRWLRDQAFAFWSDRANFAPASSTT